MFPASGVGVPPLQRKDRGYLAEILAAWKGAVRKQPRPWFGKLEPNKSSFSPLSLNRGGGWTA